MKSVSSLLAVLATAAVVAIGMGCSEEDDNDRMPGGDIRGTWTFGSAQIRRDVINADVTPEIAGIMRLWSNATAAGATANGGAFSGVYFTNSGSGAFAGTWSVVINRLTVTYEGLTQVFTFGVVGNVLTIVGDVDYQGTMWQLTMVMNR